MLTEAPETARIDAAGLRALAREVLGPGVALGLCRIGDRTARALHHPELAQMGGATPARVLEFVAGRVAARAAMGRDVPVLMGTDRAPLWPEGVVGTITHGAGWALAAVADAGPLALDLEPDADLPGDVWDIVLSGAESAWALRQPEPGRAARLIFSIKECAYKAQYPRSRSIFDFDRFAVEVDDGGFLARFTEDTGPFPRGFAMRGHYQRSQGVILTGIAP